MGWAKMAGFGLTEVTPPFPVAVYSTAILKKISANTYAIIILDYENCLHYYQVSKHPINNLIFCEMPRMWDVRLWKITKGEGGLRTVNNIFFQCFSVS